MVVAAETLDAPSYPKEAFHDLYQLEASSFWFRNRNRVILWSFKTFFPKAKSYLEVGCGTGFVLKAMHDEFPDLQLNGAELFEEGLEYARQRVPDANLFQLDICKNDFKGQFDVIGAFDVVEHIETDLLALSQVRPLLSKNGGLMLTVPQHKFLWSIADEYACHARRYEASELKSVVEKAGFEVVFMTSFVSLLMPMLMLSRLSKKKAEDFDPFSEFKIPRWLDFALDKILTVERMFIRAGMRFPAGGSLLLIARAKN